MQNEELIKSKDAEIAALMTRIRRLEEEKADMSQNLKEKNAEIAERDEKLKILDTEKKDFREKIRKLTDMDSAKSAQNLLGARMINRSLEGELRNVRSESDRLRQDKDKIEAELATEREKGNSGKEELTKLRKQVDQLLFDKERSADAVRMKKQGLDNRGSIWAHICYYAS